MISGNMVGSYSQLGRTLTIVDENGEELIGVIVDQETKFTACDNDVRKGMIYAGDDGVSTGTKDIPIYRTRAGVHTIMPNSKFAIPIPEYNGYDYTTFQCMIALVDFSDINNSVSTSMISIKDYVYEVNSTTKLANVSKNQDTQSIDLNINNNSNNYFLIYYFTYRQEE